MSIVAVSVRRDAWCRAAAAAAARRGRRSGRERGARKPRAIGRRAWGGASDKLRARK